jgi:hypothetical protein
MVKAAPLPRPAIPARTGKEISETTRKATVRLPPEGGVTVTRTTDPT